MVHCGACEVGKTSLHVPPTHLRAHWSLVKPGNKPYRSVFRARGFVDTCVSWKPRATDDDLRYPRFAPLGTRTSTAHQKCNNTRSSARILGPGVVQYQANLFRRPLQHSQQNPGSTTSPADHLTDRIHLNTPAQRQSTCFPLMARLE